MKTKAPIFRTKRMVNNWEQYTDRFRTIVRGESNGACFDLPGRGGRMTQDAADRVHALWREGKTAVEIQSITGCQIAF